MREANLLERPSWRCAFPTCRCADTGSPARRTRSAFKCDMQGKRDWLDINADYKAQEKKESLIYMISLLVRHKSYTHLHSLT